LTNDGLSILFVPNGYDASEFTVQTSIPGQVNLVVGTPNGGISTIRFWDDGHTATKGTILGGNGVWNNTDTTLEQRRWLKQK